MSPAAIWKRCLLAFALLLSCLAPAWAGYAIDGLILSDNVGPAYYDATTTAKVGVFTHNDLVSPMLINPYGNPYGLPAEPNNKIPSFIPKPASPALGWNDDVVNIIENPAECSQDGCRPVLRDVCYRGAIPPISMGYDWTVGWTYYNFNGAGRADINYGKPLVMVSGDIGASTNWTNANNYLLIGRVRVLPPAVLTIQAGTVVFGQKSSVGFLMVDRGARLVAIGTDTQPIIFTSDQAPGSMAPGDFGGVVINGRAIANCADCLGGASCISEGTDAEHCGTDDCDNSGTLRFCRVEYAGHEVAPNNELNGWTFNSLGAGTTVDYLQSFRGSDDLFEWFGGACTCTHLVGYGGWDDGLDWQMGFRGGVQFALIQQWGDGSDKGIEADNNEFTFNAPCRSNPVMANLTLVSTRSGGATSTYGIHLRRGTDAQIYNSIVVGWPSAGIRIEHPETCVSAYGDPGVYACPRGYIVDGTIFYNNAGGIGDGSFYDATTQTKMASFTHNDLGANPQLGDPNNPASPNWVPAAGSPAVAPNNETVYPTVHASECVQPGALPDLTASCWRGGVPPASMGDDWTQGWIYTNFNGAGRTDIDYGKPTVNVIGDIAANTTWSNSSNYLLIGRVRVLPPATLTIQPGTVIFGQKTSVGFLMVDRGAKLVAVGTKTQPIIFTSDQAPGSMAPGDFGGVVINGRAIANCADCLGGVSCISEGTDAEHCGTDDNDSSGILMYCRVEYAGHEVAPNNELNAWTFNSLGAGTRVEYLNSFRGSDDLFEWFGGSCTAKHLIGQGGWDDGLDWQMGFHGGVQFAVIQQWGDGSDKGIEADNNEFAFNAPCRSNPVLSNLTLINTGGTTSTHGIHLRRGTDAQIYNSIVMGWRLAGLRIEHPETCTTPYPDGLVFCAGGFTSNVTPGTDANGLFVRTLANPVGPEARFFFNLPEGGHTRLSVFDVNGRSVGQPVDETLAAGEHSATWSVPDGSASGTYFYRLESNGRIATGQLVAVR